MKSTFFGENPIFFGDDIEVNPAMQQFPLNANASRGRARTPFRRDQSEWRNPKSIDQISGHLLIYCPQKKQTLLESLLCNGTRISVRITRQSDGE